MGEHTKRDFGSFHSSNVQELLSIPEEDYEAPKLPFECPHFSEMLTGGECRHAHFMLEECTFLNHGAFGGVLKEALEFSQKCQMYVERQPLRFYDRELFPHMVHVSRRLSKFIGCDATDLALVCNVTTAMNSVIRGLKLKKDDVVYILSVTYGAVKKLLQAVCAETGAKLVEVKVNFPIKDRQQIITLVDETLDSQAAVAVFDHIPSNTPFIMPVKEIVQICKKRKVPVVIDGAHALGTLTLDLHDLDPDYYMSNAHKWFCCPKGSAFLYVRKELQAKTRPLIISHGYGSGFNSEFIWAGLHDYSPFLAMNVSLNFWENLGSQSIQKYMYDLCHQACDTLTKLWGTRLAAPINMFGCMALVGLPSRLYEDEDNVSYNTGEVIQNRLYHEHNIEVPVKCIQGGLYVRISCHLYNELQEYEKLGETVLQLCDVTSPEKKIKLMSRDSKVK